MPICSFAAAIGALRRCHVGTSFHQRRTADPTESLVAAPSPACGAIVRLAGVSSDERRDCVLELRAPDADVDQLRARRLQLRLRLRDVGTRRDAGGKPILGQLQRLFVQRHRPPQQVRICVQAVKLEVRLGELRLKRELRVLEIGRRRLRRVFIRGRRCGGCCPRCRPDTRRQPASRS